jgi:hypothetical protein
MGMVLMAVLHFTIHFFRILLLLKDIAFTGLAVKIK